MAGDRKTGFVSYMARHHPGDDRQPKKVALDTGFDFVLQLSLALN
jgi:hypothetical protein